jgi:hypothetical protein
VARGYRPSHARADLSAADLELIACPANLSVHELASAAATMAKFFIG